MNYNNMSRTELVTKRNTVETELKSMGEKFTMLPIGSEERDFYGCQITGLYAQLGAINKVLKAISYAH
jgi:hypothetical protein